MEDKIKVGMAQNALLFKHMTKIAKVDVQCCTYLYVNHVSLDGIIPFQTTHRTCVHWTLALGDRRAARRGTGTGGLVTVAGPGGRRARVFQKPAKHLYS